MLTGKPRSVSARALRDLVLICFDKRVFRTLLLANSRIHRQLDAALAERLRVAFLEQADTAYSRALGRRCLERARGCYSLQGEKAGPVID